MAVMPPEELIQRTAGGGTVLFAGSGLSRPQFPGWNGLLTDMLQWAVGQGIQLDSDSISELIREGSLQLAAQALYNQAGEAEFHEYLHGVFRRPGLKRNAAHRLLRQIPFASILTTNYDTLIEDALPRGTPKYTQLDVPELASWMRNPHLAVVKVHGDIDRRDTIVLTQQDYRDQTFSNGAFRVFLTNLFTSKTVLFLGYGLADPDLLLFLEQLRFSMKGQLRPHFALMRTQGMNAVKRQYYEKTYGIRILGDAQRAEEPDIHGFLANLKGALPPRATGRSGRPRARQAGLEPPNVKELLEAMGQRILHEQGPYYFGEYRSGGEIHRLVTRYLPQAPEVRDLDELLQAIARYGVSEGILLSELPVPEAVSGQASSMGIRVYERHEFIGRLADFEPYLAKLREEYEKDRIESCFVPLRVRHDRAGQPSGDPLPLDGFIAEWLAAPAGNHLSLLGDFGTGKTWFCRRLAYRLATAGGGRIPLVIALRDYSRAYDVEQMLTDAVVNRLGVGLPAGFKTLQCLNEEGRLLLIFDGFDEMERRVSDYRTAVENFWEIAKLVSPRAKVILTCRTEFFRHGGEEDELLRRAHGKIRIPKGNDYIELTDKKGYDLVHLLEFDDEQVRQALQLRKPESWQTLQGRISSLTNIQDMAHRPVLLDMIARTLDSIPDAERLNVATLYETYTEELLATRIRWDIPPIAPDKRRAFLRELAWDMQRTSRFTIPFTEFPRRVTEHFGLKDKPEQVPFYERDIRTQSYLVRDPEGNYRFAHKSMMEYFVACQVAGLLKKGDTPELPLTSWIVRFVHYLLARGFGYDRRVEDGMALVPAGPFISGWEEQKNPRFSRTERPFWIDVHPVTNAQFCQFLNERGDKESDVAGWIDLKDSPIRVKRGVFHAAPEYDNHPVIYVSWHGAKAYADWKHKRLPTDQEWEKAARGIDGRRFPWGEEFSTEECNTARSEIHDTTPVGRYGSLGSSPYGCEDMAGNVWEWTASSQGSLRLLRGGSWLDDPRLAACACSTTEQPAKQVINIGFRCAKTDT